MNSLIKAAGECIPRKGTMSTCNQLSTAEPTTAPATSPPMVIIVALPAKAHKASETHSLRMNDTGLDRIKRGLYL